MKPHNSSGPHRPTPAEPIIAGQLWPIALVHTRLGWGARARAAAIRQGLLVHRWGGRAYVATDDLITFLIRQSDSVSGSEAILPQERQGSNGECCQNCCEP